MESRSYSQFCPLAYTLDLLGERWTLLIVRELLTGPRRFKDLTVGLPGISTNLLAQRLSNLERQGILSRRRLPPPAGSTVYELTPCGQELERAVLELGRWGARLLPPSLEGNALPSVGTCALGIKAFFRPERARGIDRTFEWRLGNEILQVQVRDSEVYVRQGEALRADAVFHTDVPTYLGLFSGQLDPDEAVSRGLIQIDGDPDSLCRFLDLCGLPSPREASAVSA